MPSEKAPPVRTTRNPARRRHGTTSQRDSKPGISDGPAGSTSAQRRRSVHNPRSPLVLDLEFGRPVQPLTPRTSQSDRPRGQGIAAPIPSVLAPELFLDPSRTEALRAVASPKS